MSCVSKIAVDYSKCYKKCEGLQVTSYDLNEANQDLVTQISSQYDAYKEVYDFANRKGNILH